MKRDPAQPETTDILERMADLLKQATTEKSHYYTASVLRAAIAEIVRLRCNLMEMENANG